jgi:hypothetical protein
MLYGLFTEIAPVSEPVLVIGAMSDQTVGTAA